MNGFTDYLNHGDGVLVRTVAPAVEPVGIDEVRAHSRIDRTDENIDIQGKIVAVRQSIERMNNLVFITQTWTYSLRCFPLGQEISIPMRPVQSITKIEYLRDGALADLPSTNIWQADLEYRPPRILLLSGASWPSLADHRAGSVIVTFKAGYGDRANDVPYDLQQYLLIKIADIFENRESYMLDKPTTIDFVENIIRQERLY